MLDDPRDRVDALERQLADLRALLDKSEQLRNADQERLAALESEISRLRDLIRRQADVNDGLKVLFDSEHYARRGMICVRPNLPVHHLELCKTDAFLIMPFTPDWSNAIEGVVRGALHKCGIGCIRADKLTGRQIVHDVWKSICECGLVVADITGCNGNVLYELGLAEAIGKRVILISQSVRPEQLVFDLLGLRLIPYDRDKLDELTANLVASIRGTTQSVAARGAQ